MCIMTSVMWLVVFEMFNVISLMWVVVYDMCVVTSIAVYDMCIFTSIIAFVAFEKCIGSSIMWVLLYDMCVVIVCWNHSWRCSHQSQQDDLLQKMRVLPENVWQKQSFWWTEEEFCLIFMQETDNEEDHWTSLCWRSCSLWIILLGYYWVNEHVEISVAWGSSRSSCGWPWWSNESGEVVWHVNCDLYDMNLSYM